MMRHLPFLFLLIFLGGCPSVPPVPPPNPPVDTDWCGKMCGHLKGLGCEEGEPLYNNDIAGPVDVPNQSCEENCVELQDKGFFVNPRCVAQVASCEDIEPYRQKESTTCGVEPTK